MQMRQEFIEAPLKLSCKPAPLCLALPHNHYTPPKLPEHAAIASVSHGISLQLLYPKGSVIARSRTIPAAPVPMPKAPIYENHRFEFRKDNVGSTR